MSLTQFMSETKAAFPKFHLVKKSESSFMKVLAKLLFVINPTFMSKYTTTINTTVYVPDGWDTWTEFRQLMVLRHERVHMFQVKRHGFLVFALLYLFVPLPLGLAWFRAKFEREAYTESMRYNAEVNGIDILADETYKKSMCGQFTTGAYGWMWPFSASVSKWYEETRTKIEKTHGA